RELDPVYGPGRPGHLPERVVHADHDSAGVLRPGEGAANGGPGDRPDGPRAVRHRPAGDPVPVVGPVRPAGLGRDVPGRGPAEPGGRRVAGPTREVATPATARGAATRRLCGAERVS